MICPLVSGIFSPVLNIKKLKKLFLLFQPSNYLQAENLVTNVVIGGSVVNGNATSNVVNGNAMPNKSSVMLVNNDSSDAGYQVRINNISSIHS